MIHLVQVLLGEILVSASKVVGVVVALRFEDPLKSAFTDFRTFKFIFWLLNDNQPIGGQDVK